MKKESIIKKIVVNSLLGFPIGITLLMISYVNLYLILGEEVFKNEITQLQNVEVLVLQLIIIGFAYYLFFIFISLFNYFNENKAASDKFVVEHPCKSVLIMILPLLVNLFILILLRSNIFSDNISIVNCISFIVIFAISSFCLCIKNTIESIMIKKINKKLKERNK